MHTHLYRTQIYARPAARLAGTPVVLTTEHSIGETHIERRKMTAGVRGLYLASELFSDATIAVSDIVRERLIRWGVPARKITVIPNGLDTAALAFDPAARQRVREQFGITPDTYVIGSLGRLDPNKRIDLLVEAALPMLGERCKILVIGRGEDQARMEAAVARLGAADHVIFGGFQSDTAAMMSAFDLYVAASVQETFGLSVLEAMASGLPVLYTACPALDGIETGQARQVAGTVEALRAEIRRRSRPGRCHATASPTTRSFGDGTAIGEAVRRGRIRRPAIERLSARNAGCRTGVRTRRERMKVALTAEGTYPHQFGGVSVWCDQLIRGLPQHEFTVIPLVATGNEADALGAARPT